MYMHCTIIKTLMQKSVAHAGMKPRVSPIEVKSGKRYSPVSLNIFKAKFDKRIGTEYVLHTKPFKAEDDRLSVPLYTSFCL